MLDSSEQFEVYLPEMDGSLTARRVEYANLATVDGGTLEFWHVVDDVWHQIAVFAPEYWASFVPVEKEQRDAVAPPEAPVVDAEPFQHQEDTVEARLTVDVPEAERQSPLTHAPTHETHPLHGKVDDEGRFIAVTKAQQEHAELRAKIRDDLARGIFPTEQLESLNGVIRPPAKLKDIWEGKGEATDDGTDEDSWPMNGSQEDIDAWVARRNASEEARVQQLRQQSDAEFEKHPQPADRLPSHLKDSSVSGPTGTVLASTAPFTGDTLKQSFDYSPDVANSVQDAIAYGRQQREVVDSWHGPTDQ